MKQQPLSLFAVGVGTIRLISEENTKQSLYQSNLLSLEKDEILVIADGGRNALFLLRRSGKTPTPCTFNGLEINAIQ